MAELTDNVEILRNAVIDYRDRVVPDIWAERNFYRAALEEIARRPPVERNPDGVDQAAFTMQLIAREALGAADPIAPGPTAPSPRKARRP